MAADPQRAAPLPTAVWNKGIAARCDRRIPDEFPDGRGYVPDPTLAGQDVERGTPDLIADPDQYADIGGGELVWVRGSWLSAFVAQVLPLIRGTFVLVTGDSDSSVPSASPEVATALLQCPHLVRWYTQNHDGSRPGERISPVPIGLDLHTLSERPMWGEEVATPAAQEALLRDISEALPPLTDRDQRLYIDFGWSTNAQPPRLGARLLEPRHQIAAGLRSLAHVVADPPRPRSEIWRRRGQHAFSASPHGNGLDAHRTWEGLALGQVVLVPTSSLDPLFDDVRAVPISSWDDITEANMRRWLVEAADIPHPSPALISAHWVDRMSRALG
ncbi:MAG: hypothetical protein ACSLFP_10190 [Acidimicrobiales bacterium]